MPTPEEQKQYTKLSCGLRQVGLDYAQQLPAGAASLLLHPIYGRLYLDAYDRNGKLIGTRRSDQMPEAMRLTIEQLANEACPNPDGITAML
jgi:hypothetical protein